MCHLRSERGASVRWTFRGATARVRVVRRLRYRGRLVVVDAAPHCPDEAPTLLAEDGERVCLLCGPVGAGNPSVRVSPWLPEPQRQRAWAELVGGEE